MSMVSIKFLNVMKMSEILNFDYFRIDDDLIEALFDSPEMLQEKVITSVS